MIIKRGDVFIANLDPVVGREIAKSRPVVVISSEMNNKYSGTVTVLPVTSKKTEKIYPFEMFLPKGSGNLPKDSKVKADQIRTLDKRRLVSLLGRLHPDEMRVIEKAVKIHLALS